MRKDKRRCEGLFGLFCFNTDLIFSPRDELNHFDVITDYVIEVVNQRFKNIDKWCVQLEHK